MLLRKSTGRLVTAALIFFARAWAQTPGPEEQSKRARELMAAGRYAEAIPIYAELVRGAPGDAGLLLDLGMAQHLAGDDRKAATNLDAALKLKPDLVPARYLLAETCIALERFDRAADLFRSVANVRPQDPRVWHGLGRSYEALAASSFEALLQAAPESAYVVHLVGTVKRKDGQNSAAEQLLKQAVARMPSLRGPHADLAELYRATNRADLAKREEQLAAAPCSGVECDYRAGKYLDVISKTSGAATPQSLYWRIQAYNELSVRAFSELGKLPESAELHEVKAQILRNRGQHAESAEEWRNVLRLTPGDRQARKELAISIYLSRDWAAALAALTEELKSSPDAADLNLLTGDTLLHLEEPEKALPYLEKAVRLDPRGGAHAPLGLAYARLGQPEKAIPHLKAALASDEDGSLHYQLARAYQATGQTELARQAMAEYQKIKNRAPQQ